MGMFCVSLYVYHHIADTICHVQIVVVIDCLDRSENTYSYTLFWSTSDTDIADGRLR